MYSNRYTDTVARYVNQTSELTELTSRQFAATMLRNAKLTPDTLNSLMFQLTTKISNKMAGAKSIQIKIRDTDAHAINVFMKGSNVQGTPNFDVIDNLSNNISALITRSKAECNISVIGMHETAQSLAQVRVVAEGSTQEIVTRGSMLGKRTSGYDSQQRVERIKKIKSETRCKGCDEIGHWYRDQSECIEKVRGEISRQHGDRRNGSGQNNRTKAGETNNNIGAFFQEEASRAPY